MNDGTETTRTVRNDGVTARKTVEDDGSVRIDVESERDTPATVRVTDPTLESRSDGTVEFHTDYGDKWGIDDASAFERAFDPDERRTIRYRIPDADPEALETDPRLSVTERPALDGIVDRARSDALRELVGGDRDSLASDPTTADRTAETGESPGEDAAVETTVDGDTEGDSERDTTPGHGPASDGADDGEPDDSVASVDSVARSLLEEIRDGTVDEEVAIALRSELGGGGNRSQEVRLSHLQSEVSDLAAYTDTIESFIDRHGTFDSVVDDVRSELSALEDRTRRVESTAEDLPETVDRVDEIEAELGEIRSMQSTLESELEGIQAAQTDLESQFERLDEDFTEVDDRLEEFELFKQRISGVFRDLQTDDLGP